MNGRHLIMDVFVDQDIGGFPWAFGLQCLGSIAIFGL